MHPIDFEDDRVRVPRGWLRLETGGTNEADLLRPRVSRILKSLHLIAKVKH